MVDKSEYQFGYISENKRLHLEWSNKLGNVRRVTLVALTEDGGYEIRFDFHLNFNSKLWDRELRVINDYCKQTKPFKDVLKVLSKDEKFYNPDHFCEYLEQCGYEVI